MPIPGYWFRGIYALAKFTSPHSILTWKTSEQPFHSVIIVPSSSRSFWSIPLTWRVSLKHRLLGTTPQDWPTVFSLNRQKDRMDGSGVQLPHCFRPCTNFGGNSANSRTRRKTYKGTGMTRSRARCSPSRSLLSVLLAFGLSFIKQTDFCQI